MASFHHFLPPTLSILFETCVPVLDLHDTVAKQIAINSCDVDPAFLHVDPPGKRAIIERAK